MSVYRMVISLTAIIEVGLFCALVKGLAVMSASMALRDSVVPNAVETDGARQGVPLTDDAQRSRVLIHQKTRENSF